MLISVEVFQSGDFRGRAPKTESTRRDGGRNEEEAKEGGIRCRHRAPLLFFAVQSDDGPLSWLDDLKMAAVHIVFSTAVTSLHEIK